MRLLRQSSSDVKPNSSPESVREVVVRLALTSVTYKALSTTSLRCCFPFFPPLHGRGVAGAAVFLDPRSSCRGRAEGGEESSPVVRARGCVTVTERPRGVLGVLRWCVGGGVCEEIIHVKRLAQRCIIISVGSIIVSIHVTVNIAVSIVVAVNIVHGGGGP